MLVVEQAIDGATGKLVGAVGASEQLFSRLRTPPRRLFRHREVQALAAVAGGFDFTCRELEVGVDDRERQVDQVELRAIREGFADAVHADLGSADISHHLGHQHRLAHPVGNGVGEAGGPNVGHEAEALTRGFDDLGVDLFPLVVAQGGNSVGDHRRGFARGVVHGEVGAAVVADERTQCIRVEPVLQKRLCHGAVGLTIEDIVHGGMKLG